MNEITAITPQVKDKRRCNVYIDGRFYCGLTLETTVKNRLKVGQIVSPETLSAIQLESEKDGALDKALTHLSATRKTERQIGDFLRKKGYLEGVIDYVVDKLKGYGFLDDGEYAESYAEFAAKKKGVRLIRAEMRKRGLSEEVVDAAMESVDEQTQEEAARGILEKYMRNKPVDRTSLQKAANYLVGKGFSYDVIKRALRAFGEMEEE